MPNLIETIAEKVATLPPERQREALAFIESLAESSKEKKRFRSVRGALQMDLDTLDEDLEDVRREMWRSFPREEPG
ncbi:MAG: DUF2281 domain-containing protein [Pyrinomonadaceae bacterium]